MSYQETDDGVRWIDDEQPAERPPASQPPPKKGDSFQRATGRVGASGACFPPAALRAINAEEDRKKLVAALRKLCTIIQSGAATYGEIQLAKREAQSLLREMGEL